MNRFLAVDLDEGAAVVTREGAVEFGNRHSSGVEFSLWSVDGHTIAFLPSVPGVWPTAAAMKAESIVALIGDPVSNGQALMLSAVAQGANQPRTLLAAAAAVGAVGFALVPAAPRTLIVVLEEVPHCVTLEYGDPNNDEPWAIFVEPDVAESS